MILIPLYFDLPARSSNWLAKVAWYGVVVFIPVAVQFDGFPSAVMPVIDTLRETTEAFIAALAISIFFDILPKHDGETKVEAAETSGAAEEMQLPPA